MTSKGDAVKPPKRRLRRYWPVSLLLVCLLIGVAVSMIDFNHPSVASIIDINHPRIRPPKQDDPRDFLPDIRDTKRMAAALGNQGELSAKHLTLRWSAGCKRELPVYVEVKVPREYLFRDPLFVNENCVQKLHVGLTVPGSAPWPDNARREGLPIDPKSLEAHPRKWPQSAHLVLRPGSSHAYRGVDYWRDLAKDRKNYMRVDDLAGLERSLRLSCFAESAARDHPGTRAFLEAKSPEDKSPPNCWTVPGAAILVTPRSATSNEEVVAIVCEQTSCDIKFATGLLWLEVNIPHQNIERWQEIVAAARELAQSFVVRESKDAYEIGIKVLTGKAQ